MIYDLYLTLKTLASPAHHMIAIEALGNCPAFMTGCRVLRSCNCNLQPFLPIFGKKHPLENLDLLNNHADLLNICHKNCQKIKSNSTTATAYDGNWHFHKNHGMQQMRKEGSSFPNPEKVWSENPPDRSSLRRQRRLWSNWAAEKRSRRGCGAPAALRWWLASWQPSNNSGCNCQRQSTGDTHTKVVHVFLPAPSPETAGQLPVMSTCFLCRRRPRRRSRVPGRRRPSSTSRCSGAGWRAGRPWSSPLCQESKTTTLLRMGC